MTASRQELRRYIRERKEAGDEAFGNLLTQTYLATPPDPPTAPIRLRWGHRANPWTALKNTGKTTTKSLGLTSPGWMTWMVYFHKPIRPVGTKRSKSKGENLDPIGTTRIIPEQLMQPGKPGPEYDLACAQTLQERYPNITTAAVQFIKSAWQHDVQQRQALRDEDDARKLKTKVGALRLVNEFERDEIHAELQKLRGGAAIRGSDPHIFASDIESLIPGSADENDPNCAWVKLFFSHAMDYTHHYTGEKILFADGETANTWLTLETGVVDWAARQGYADLTYCTFHDIILITNDSGQWSCIVADSHAYMIHLFTRHSRTHSPASLEQKLTALSTLMKTVTGSDEEPIREFACKNGWQRDNVTSGLDVCLTIMQRLTRVKDFPLQGLELDAEQSRNARQWIMRVIMDEGLSEELVERMRVAINTLVMPASKQ